jgi:cobalamin biosynthesis protein CbiD
MFNEDVRRMGTTTGACATGFSSRAIFFKAQDVLFH